MLRGVLHVCWDIYVVVGSGGQTQVNLKQFRQERKAPAAYNAQCFVS